MTDDATARPPMTLAALNAELYRVAYNHAAAGDDHALVARLFEAAELVGEADAMLQAAIGR